MIHQFSNYSVVFSGIVKLLIILAVGFILAHRKMITKQSLEGLTVVLVWLCMPALIFGRVTTSFDPASFPRWWLFPLYALAMEAIGLATGWCVQKLFQSFKERREFVTSCAFENCGYLPMTLIAFMSIGALQEKLLIYIFLYLTGFNIGIWLFAPPFLGREKSIGSIRKAIVNVPIIANVIAIVGVLVFGKGWLPPLLSDPITMVGNASFPLSMLVVGMTLAVEKGYRTHQWGGLSACVATKLVLFPVVVLSILHFFPLHEIDKFVIFLEAIMPSAVTLVVIGQYKNANNAFLSGTIFYSHVAALVTIPVWLFVYGKLCG